MKKHQI